MQIGIINADIIIIIIIVINIIIIMKQTQLYYKGGHCRRCDSYVFWYNAHQLNIPTLSRIAQLFIERVSCNTVSRSLRRMPGLLDSLGKSVEGEMFYAL